MEASKNLTAEPRSMVCKACVSDFNQAPHLPCPDCGGPTEPLLGECATCGAETDDADIRTCADCGAYEDAQERAFEWSRDER